MRRMVHLAAAAALMIGLAGCAMSSRITTRDQLTRLQGRLPIIVYAQGDRVYSLQSFAMADSSIRGSGTLTERRHKTPFKGDIPFSRIVAIKADSPAVLKMLVIAGITGLFVAELVEAGSHRGLDATVGTTYHLPAGIAPGTSCPYVYAWDGTRFRLQAEPFGVAWGRALELTTWHLLPAARAERGVVRMRLANERRETHYVNSVALYRIDLGTASTAALDGEGIAWPVSHPSAPILAQDRSGRDLLPRIAAADQQLWECDSSSMTAGARYEDVLEVAFLRPRHALTGSLLLTGINTTFSTAVYRHMCRWVGDQTPALAHAIETDPRMIAVLRDYIRDASLGVSVWSGHGWVPAGDFLPEANAVAFTRALRIRVPGGAGDTVRVRLRSMADVWRIDALSVDWADARPLPMTRIDLRSAVGSSGEDLRVELDADDGRYAILVPPDRVDLTFAVADSRASARVAYAVAARGYLMEWEPPAAEVVSTPTGPGESADQRIASLEELLRHRDLALGPVYADWRKVRRISAAGAE